MMDILSKLSKLLYILVLATLIMYVIATKNINNTLEHRVCENELVRYYIFSLSVESPRYQQWNQINKSSETRMFSLAYNVLYIRIILQTFQASISFKTNEKFDLVAASHKLINIIPPINWYVLLYFVHIMLQFVYTHSLCPFIHIELIWTHLNSLETLSGSNRIKSFLAHLISAVT